MDTQLKRPIRIGLIARADNSGLGTLSWEFARHLKPHKVLLVASGVYQTFPERYDEFHARIIAPRHSFTDLDMRWLTDGIDVLLSIETFYNWEVVAFCRKIGVKTALVTMIEMTAERLPAYPDLFICPSKLDYDYFSKIHTSKFVPIPLDTERLAWKERKKAKTFIHTASHGGVAGRKGTSYFIEAMNYVQSHVKAVIYSWVPFKNENPKVEVRIQNFRNYWQCWSEGDVLVYPQDYNGICLPIVEAMASGLGVITTDIYPFNEYMPKELLFKPVGSYTTRVQYGAVPMKAAKIDPFDIAKKIDEVAAMDLTPFSNYGKEWAQKNSWEALLPRYQQILEELCAKG